MNELADHAVRTWRMLGRVTSRAVRTVRTRLSERGEGVISTAIAVLIMAFLGVGMWAAFSSTFDKASQKVDHKVSDCVGASSASPDC